MTRAVSIVIPALRESALLERALRSLEPEIRSRAVGDEIIVVDDSGERRIAAWLDGFDGGVRCTANESNLGFARALSAGIESARHEFVFAMNSDVIARSGFLAPLCAALEDERVFAAVPRILLGGAPSAVESLVAVRLEGGVARGAQPALEAHGGFAFDSKKLEGRFSVPFPIGGACLMRKSLFAELGGFDPAFEPFYLEDLDLGWRAWKAGFRCLYVGDSVVEHHHRGTIGALIPDSLVRTAIERNRLLFTWKHLDRPRLLSEHVRELCRLAAESLVAEDRIFLSALCLALEDRGKVLAKNAPTRAEGSSFERIQSESDPFRAD